MIALDTTVSRANLNTTIPNLSQTKDLNKLREKSDDFEAMIIKQMLDISMKESENSLFGKTTGNKIYSSMYHDALGKEMSGGFGYSELLFNFLKKNI